eukprot:3934286-Rhodomonas_salina.1
MFEGGATVMVEEEAQPASSLLSTVLQSVAFDQQKNDGAPDQLEIGGMLAMIKPFNASTKEDRGHHPGFDERHSESTEGRAQ